MIFDKIVDKESRGVREDRVVRLLPNSCFEQDPLIVATKFGLNPMLFPSKEDRADKSIPFSTPKKRRRSKVKKQDLRIISRGAFLSMFSYESAAFIQTMYLNHKSILVKRTEKKLGSMLSKIDSRGRSQSAPSITPMKQPKLQRSDSNSSHSSSSCASASPSPNRRHRRKKSRVVQDINPFGDADLNIDTNTNMVNGRARKSGKTSKSRSKHKRNKEEKRRHRKDKSAFKQHYNTSSMSDGYRSDSNNANLGHICSFFSLCEASIKKWFPRLNIPKQQESIFDDESLSKYLELETGSEHDTSFKLSIPKRDASAYNPSAKEVIRNAESIAVYLMTVDDQEGLEEDSSVQRRRHRRSPSFSMSDSEDDSTAYSSTMH